MENFKQWWWRRRLRWQQWCRTDSSITASSAEIANAKSISASGYRKQLLDVVTTDVRRQYLRPLKLNASKLALKLWDVALLLLIVQNNINNLLFEIRKRLPMQFSMSRRMPSLLYKCPSLGIALVRHKRTTGLTSEIAIDPTR